jgi:hypothetical protein
MVGTSRGLVLSSDARADQRRRRCVELIGDADVLRPWGWDPDGSHVKAEVGWMVLEPTRMAVRDHQLVTRMNPVDPG